MSKKWAKWLVRVFVQQADDEVSVVKEFGFVDVLMNYGTRKPHQYIVDISRGRAISVCRLYNTKFDWFSEIFHQVSDVAGNLLVSTYATFLQ